MGDESVSLDTMDKIDDELIDIIEDVESVQFSNTDIANKLKELRKMIY